VRFWAFLGKGSSKTREKKIVSFKKNHRGNIFSGGIFFLDDFFKLLFLSIFVVALVKRLSVRGTQKRDKKVLRGRASNFFPPYRFFLGRFWAFLDEGNSKTRLKKSRHRTCTKAQSWPNKVRTYIGCFFFNFFSAAPCAVSLLHKKRPTAPPAIHGHHFFGDRRSAAFCVFTKGNCYFATSTSIGH
jgi:hypothetical protein